MFGVPTHPIKYTKIKRNNDIQSIRVLPLLMLFDLLCVTAYNMQSYSLLQFC